MKITLLLSLLIYSYDVFAQDYDPFNSTQRQQVTLSHISQTEPSIPTQCILRQHIIAHNILFEQLKIVGILHYKTQKKVFFNYEKHLFTAKIGDFIAQQQFKINDINEQEIQLVGWQKDCSAGDILSIKF